MPRRWTGPLALLLAGASTVAPGAARAERAVAEILDASGKRVATATFVEEGDRVRLRVEATGLSPGQHGIHVHAIGRCDPPAFVTAGGHFNPLGRKHGLDAADGPHAGDLPNLEANASGWASYEAVTDRLTLRDGPASIFDADGSALVIHEREDDQRTDPTGSSGGRVACGVIVRRN